VSRDTIPPMMLRVGIAIYAVLTVILFTMAAVHNNDPFWGDTSVLSALRVDDDSWQRFFARFDTRAPIALSIVLVVSIPLLLMRKWLEAAAYVFLLPILLVTASLPKLLVKRLRPDGTLEGMTDSFPSGTATVAILLLGLLIFLVGEFVAPRRLRITIQLALGVGIILLGLFRLLAGEHWPSDILAGYMGGGLALIAIIWAYRQVRDHRLEKH